MKDKLDSCSERVEINNLYLQMLDISHGKQTQKLMLDIYSMRDLGTHSVMGVYVPTHVGHKMEVKNLKIWLNGKPRVLPNP